MSYATYLKLAEFLGIDSRVTEKTYRRIADQRPNRLPRVCTITDWSMREIAEFETQVQPAAEQFGYEYRVSKLPPVLRLEPRKQAFCAVPYVVLRKLSHKALQLIKSMRDSDLL
jgi:hypothetical protein